MKRRNCSWLLLALAAGRTRAAALHAQPPVFPRDRGAHPAFQTEWWYATGWLGSANAPLLGFQLTFFRSRTGLENDTRSRFAAPQLLFAHAALTDLRTQRHFHAQRIARWSGAEATLPAHASLHETDVRIGDWSLQRDGDVYRARLPASDFRLELALHVTQPALLQGEAGISRKGADARHSSHYVSQPQLAVQAVVSAQGAAQGSTQGSEQGSTKGQPLQASGRAWLDHEWSDAYLPTGAVGWDWIGINLFDGSTLMAFSMRRADGSALWAGGSFRAAGQAARFFAADDVRFTPGRIWTSPASQARYPVVWRVDTPAGHFALHALMDAQELDSRTSTGAIYWEGLVELRDASGQRVGLGYLEMTGYAAPLHIGR